MDGTTNGSFSAHADDILARIGRFGLHTAPVEAQSRCSEPPAQDTSFGPVSMGSAKCSHAFAMMFEIRRPHAKTITGPSWPISAFDNRFRPNLTRTFCGSPAAADHTCAIASERSLKRRNLPRPARLRCLRRSSQICEAIRAESRAPSPSWTSLPASAKTINSWPQYLLHTPLPGRSEATTPRVTQFSTVSEDNPVIWQTVL